MKLQFRLRTLMIAVTLLAVPLGYVGWQAKIVRERKAWLKSHQQYGLIGGRNFTPSFFVGDPANSPSLLRQWLGDEDRDHLEADRADAARAHVLFPEAVIYQSMFDMAKERAR